MRRIRAILVIVLLGAGAGLAFRAASMSGGGSGGALAGAPVASEETLRAAVRESPKDAGANERLADRLVKQGKGDEAIGLYEAAIAAAPENVTAPYALAEVLASKGRSVEAQRILEKSLKLHPRDAATNEALADLVVASLGETAYTTVKPLYETANSADPGRARAALGLARIERAAGQVDAAAKVLEATARLNPRSVAVHMEYADVLITQHRYDAALKEYVLITGLQPENAEGWSACGEALLLAKDAKEAEIKFRKAVALKPGEAKYHVQLGESLSKDHFTEAMKEFEKAISLDEKYTPAYYQAAVALLEVPPVFWDDLKVETQAEHFLRRAIALQPDHTLAKAKLARLLADSVDPNKQVEAMVLLGSVVAETKERDLSVLVTYANALGRVGTTSTEFREQFFQRAVEQLDKAIALGQESGLAPELKERLLQTRQMYVSAMMPAAEGRASPLSVGGMQVHDAMDDPLPQPKQAPVGSLLSLPMDLSKVPRPGDVLDQATQPPDGTQSLEVPMVQQGSNR